MAAALDEDGVLPAVLPLFDAQAAASTAVPSRIAAVPARRATWVEGVMWVPHLMVTGPHWHPVSVLTLTTHGRARRLRYRPGATASCDERNNAS